MNQIGRNRTLSDILTFHIDTNDLGNYGVTAMWKHLSRLTVNIQDITFLVLCLVLISQFYCSAKDRAKTEIQRFPSFVAEDINGKMVSSDQFLRGFTYVQIGDPRRKAERIMLSRVVEEYCEYAKIVMIAERSYYSEDSGSNTCVTLLCDTSANLRKLFGLHGNDNRYFLYKKEKLIGSGYAHGMFEGKAKNMLDQIIKNKRFESNLFVPKIGDNIVHYDWLDQVRVIVLSNSNDFHLVGLFTSICEGCPSGTLIEMMKEIHKKADIGLGIWGILPSNFTKKDILGLVSQLSISFPVQVADSRLDNKWRELSTLYTQQTVSDIVILIDREGEVTGIVDRYNLENIDEFIHNCLISSTRRQARK